MLGLRTRAKTQTPTAVAKTDTKSLELLTFQRMHGSHLGESNCETASIYYATDGAAHRVFASVSWEALALLRRELTRARKTMPDDWLVEVVLRRFAEEQVKQRCAVKDPLQEDAHILLEFYGGPHSPAPRQLLQRCELLA